MVSPPLTSLRRPLPRLPANRVRPPGRVLGSGLELRHVILVAAFFMLGAHLVLGRAEFELPARFLYAMPAMPLLYEIHRYAIRRDARELPVNVLGLFYYYLAFGVGALFRVDFFDAAGPVAFTEESRLLGAAAIALGSLSIYGGMRLGELLGQRCRPLLVRVSPPAEVPSGYLRAVVWYAALCMVAIQFLLSSVFPAAVSVLLSVTISFEFAIGLTLAKPELFKGRWTRHAGTALLVLGGSGGLLRGLLDPVLRLGLATIAGRWAYARRISVRFIVALLAVYLIFQPIKKGYRAQVWQQRAGEEMGYTQRVDAWVNAFTGFWGGHDNGDEAADSAMSRVSELDSVNHAFLLLPGQVQFLDGSGWSHIATSWIPRAVWPDKPTTMDLEQRYGVVFKRQNEVGARTTAILLPLVVDGYWNFGWPGIVLACVLMGGWIGMCQRMYSGDHWALQAMGLGHLARVVAQGSVASMYSGLFQQIAGLLIASWAVYALARLLSDERRHGLARSSVVRRPPPLAPLPGPVPAEATASARSGG